jgi:hypothetical protein
MTHGQQNIFKDVLKYQAYFVRKQHILENKMQILICQFLMSYIYVFFYIQSLTILP